MALVQPSAQFEHFQYFDASAWQTMQAMPMAGVSCMSEAMTAMAMPMQQMQQMQQMQPGMMFVQVPVMMVPVFVPHSSEQQFVQQAPQSPNGRSGVDSVATDVPSPRSSDDEAGSPSKCVRPKSKGGSPTGSSRMEHLAQSLSLVACKSFGGERNDQIRSNILQNATADVELLWPDLDSRVKGSQNVRAFMLNFFDSVPDLQMSVNAITEDGSTHGMLEYTISGTASKLAMPMFPVGKWVQWKITSRYEFDHSSKVRVHQIRLGFVPGAPATAANFEGLSQCASMLASTQGGSRLLQEAIEMDGASAKSKALLMEPMVGNIWEMSLSPHGNHVVQKLIMNLFPQEVQFVVDAFRGRVVEAAQNQMQSRVLERLLEYCPPSQTEVLAEEALGHAPTLLRHSFGNFVLQAVLEHGTAEHRSLLVGAICSDVHRLARHKIASNSVRKALMASSPADQDALIRALKFDPLSFASLAKHKTGSFVCRELKQLARRMGK